MVKERKTQIVSIATEKSYFMRVITNHRDLTLIFLARMKKREQV